MTTGDVTAFGAELEAPMTLVAGGPHLLAYRAVGHDGHVITAHLRFTIAATGVFLPTAAADRQVSADRATDADAPGSGSRFPSDGTSRAWILGAALRLSGLVMFMRHSVDRGRSRGGPG